MKISPSLGLVVSFRERDWSAGPTYLKNIILALRQLPRQRQIPLKLLFLPDVADDMETYAPLMSLLDKVEILDASRVQADVLFPCMGRIVPTPSGAQAAWIPDLQHKHLPDFFSPGERAARDRQYQDLLSHCDLVVVSSQAALADLRRFYPEAFASSSPVRGFVLSFCSSDLGEGGELASTAFSGEPLPPPDPAPVLARYGLSEPYLICCNQFWAHKDHLTLFRAIGRIARAKPLRLVCTGNTHDYRNPDYFPGLLTMLDAMGIGNLVTITGFIPRLDQIQLMRAALAVVQPSLFEGWSTVLEDARMLGKTVIYSDLPVHLEQNPPYGFSFTAGDAKDLVRVLGEAAELFTPTQGSDRETLALLKNRQNRLAYGHKLLLLLDEAVGAHNRRSDGKAGTLSQALPGGIIPPGSPDRGGQKSPAGRLSVRRKPYGNQDSMPWLLDEQRESYSQVPIDEPEGQAPQENSDMTWEQAVLWLREQPGQQALVRACYFDDPLLDAAERYYQEPEWRALRELLPQLPEQRRGECLDVGAGRGIVSYALARDGWDVTALEPDKSDVTGAGAIEALARQCRLPLRVLQDFGENLSLEDARFDLIHARQVLHHARDLNSFCAELFRVLKPGAVFIATREHVVDDAKSLANFLKRHPLHHLYGGENAYTLARYLQAIQGAGFLLQRVITPLESPINTFPLTGVEVQARAAKLLGRQPGSRLDHEALRQAGMLSREPGRLFSFVALRPDK